MTPAISGMDNLRLALKIGEDGFMQVDRALEGASVEGCSPQQREQLIFQRTQAWRLYCAAYLGVHPEISPCCEEFEIPVPGRGHSIMTRQFFPEPPARS